MQDKLIEEHGYFWWHHEPIPEGQFAPDSAVSGVLTIDNEGVTYLELNGVISSNDPLNSFFKGTRQIDPSLQIQGRLKKDSKYILISDIYVDKPHISFGGISHEKLSAFHCLIGRSPFPKANKPILFNKLSVNLVGFEDWIGLGCINTKRTKTRLVVSYKKPKDIKYNLVDGKIEFKHYLSGPDYGEYNFNSTELNEEAHLIYTPKKPIDIFGVKKTFNNIESFLLLVSGSGYSLDWPKVSIGSRKKETTYTYYTPRAKASTKAPHRHDLWLRLSDIEVEFGALFDKWIEKLEQLGPGITLYLAAAKGASLYIEHKYITYIWGLETLHRNLNRVDPQAIKRQEKVSRILSQQGGNSKDRGWLKAKLKNAAEPSLEERLYDLFSNIGIKFNESSLKEFCKYCADRRNDISHFGELRGSSGKVKSEILETLIDKSNALAFLYPAVILREIGIRESLLKDVFSRGAMRGSIKRALNNADLSVEQE